MERSQGSAVLGSGLVGEDRLVLFRGALPTRPCVGSKEKSGAPCHQNNKTRAALRRPGLLLLSSCRAYLPSRSESPGTARSTVSLTRCQASRVACLACSHSRLEVPRVLFQSRPRSDSTSSNERPG